MYASFFTLFGELGSSLQQTNGTAFAKALSRSGTLDSLSETPRITLFVPLDSALQGQTLDAASLKRYVLLNTLATFASLKAGFYTTSSGDSVNVTSNADGSFSVNNAPIVRSNVMIKNGVIHYIDGVSCSFNLLRPISTESKDTNFSPIGVYAYTHRLCCRAQCPNACTSCCSSRFLGEHFLEE